MIDPNLAPRSPGEPPRDGGPDEWQVLRRFVAREASRWWGRAASLDVDDVIQETLLVVLERAPAFVREHPPVARAYARTVVRRLLARPPGRIAGGAGRPLDDDGVGVLDRLEFRLDLEEGLRSLTRRDRTIVVEYLVGDHDTRALAAGCGLSRRRVQMLLHDRLPRLRRLLRP